MLFVGNSIEKTRIDKVYGNDKLTPVIQALGTGIAAEFNMERLRYDKVIIMTDSGNSVVLKLVKSKVWNWLPESKQSVKLKD